MDLTTVGGRLIATGDDGQQTWWFGWMPPADVDAESSKLVWDVLADEGVVNGTDRAKSEVQYNTFNNSIPDFKISGSWQLDSDRYALWKAARQVTGAHLKYIWQLTGSCVGAGGDNMLKNLMCSEILAGDLEEYVEPWWPFTYGRSRSRSGMRGRGEGSTGTGWAEAIKEDGIFSVKEIEGLPDFREVGGWLQLSSQLELQWSDGARVDEKYLSLGRIHPVKQVARARSADDVVAALANGWGITQASMFGFSPMAPSPRGNPAVRIATWNGSWSHQTYIDEYWKHPTEGEIFRWGNNWGPTAHGSPTGDEPPGGVYIKKDVVDRLCRSGEVYIFSGFQGFEARENKLDWAKIAY